MFAIQPINKYYQNNRYVGLRKDTNLPYLVYEGNPDFPNDVYGFNTAHEALTYLEKFISHEGLDIENITTAQVIDLALVNNANKFQIIEYDINDGKFTILNTYPQPQFNREGW